jgi:branched-chain amino acid transport system substrate-binding protein
MNNFRIDHYAALLRRRDFIGCTIAAAATTATVGSLAQTSAHPEKLRIGIVGPFSGPFADTGILFRQGVETYLAQKGKVAGGREVEILYRDTGGTNPANAKRVVEELVIKEKVAMLGGFYLTPEVAASASTITETKTPTVLFTVATDVLKQSPYFIRVGDNLAQAALPPADWAFKAGRRKAYIAVADYAPGYYVQDVFKRRFTALGGTIVGEDRIPFNTVDFAPFAERIANAKPDLIDMFIPAGAPAVAFMRALIAQGIDPQKVAIVGMGETDDPYLKLFDDSVLGVYSSLYYAIDAPGKTNIEFKEMLHKKFGASTVPNYAVVTAYDGMHIMFRMAESQRSGSFDGAAAVKAMEGMSWESPRGPVRIEPGSREMTQNIYLRRVEKVNGQLINRIVETFPAVPAP